MMKFLIAFTVFAGTFIPLFAAFNKTLLDLASIYKFKEKLNNRIEQWLNQKAFKEKRSIGQNESKFILQLYSEKSETSFSDTILMALNISIILTSTVFLVGSIIYIVLNICSNLTKPEWIDLIIDSIFCVIYVLILKNLGKALFDKLKRGEIIFNWAVRFTYLIFLRGSILKPFLNHLFDIQTSSFPFNTGTVLSGFLVIIIVEIVIYFNQKYTIRRLILILAAIALFLVFSRSFHKIYFWSPVSDIYFGVNIWLFNFFFDLVTIRFTICILGKISKSQSNWRNIQLIVLDLFVAFILGLILFVTFPFINNLVFDFVYNPSNISFIKNWQSPSALIKKSINLDRYLHILYCLTTFIPTLLYFSFVIVIALWRKSKKTAAYGINGLFTRLSKYFNFTPITLMIYLLSFLLSLILVIISTKNLQ